MIQAAFLSGLLTQASLAPGQVAPDFTTQDIDGKTRALASMLERGPVILAFFPKAFTPG